MTKQLPLFAAIFVIVSTLIDVSVAAEKPAKSSSAYAEFLINPSGCRETFVIVDVEQTKSSTDINFLYHVRSTCEDQGDLLFYHAITASESIRKQDFKVLGSGQIAYLDTVIPVFDDEGGSIYEMVVQVIWIATGPAKNGVRPAIAAIHVEDEFSSPYITNDIFPSETGSITQTK